MGRGERAALAAAIVAMISPALASDNDTCAYGSGDAAIAACTREIESGRYSGKTLAPKYLNRGVNQKDKGAFESALSDYARAIQLNPQYPDAYYDRCILYRAQKQYDLAIADCTKAIDLPGPKNAVASSVKLTVNQARSDYFMVRGRAYVNKNQSDRGMADFNEAIRLNPKSVGSLYSRGAAYYDRKDYRPAIADFSGAIRLKPEYAAALYWRGMAKRLSGDEAGGTSDIDAARKIDPNVRK